VAQKKRIRIKGRFYVIVAAFLALLIWGIVSLVNLINPPRVEWGTLETSKESQALIIRTENTLSFSEYVRLIPIATEGSTVQEGQEIAVLYTAGYSPKDLANLMTLQQTIKDYQTNNVLKSVVDRDLDAIENDITSNLQTISQTMSEGRFDQLLELERSLITVMDRRRVYMNSTIQADSHLETLYQQERNLQNRIDANKVIVTTPMEGILSYLVDGFEAVLQPDNLADYTVSNVQSLLNDIDTSGLSVGTGEAMKDMPVFRIVQPAPWYLLILLPKTDATLPAGSVCEVEVEGYEGSLTAYVNDVRTEKNRSLMILEIRNAIDSALNLRRVSVHIGSSAEGFKVPRELLGSDDLGYYLMVRSQSGEIIRVSVTLLGSDATSAIVQNTGDDHTLNTGMRIYKP